VLFPDLPGFGLDIGPNYGPFPEMRRGWPWEFQRSIDNLERKEVEPELPPNEFSWVLLLSDVAVLATTVACASWLLLRHRRLRGTWLRFSLAEFFAIIGVIAIGLGWWARNYSEWQRERSVIERFVFIQPISDYAGPQWLRRLWRKELMSVDDLEIFERVIEIRPEPERNFTHESIIKMGVALSQLPYARSISMYNGLGQHVVSDEPSMEELERDNLVVPSIMAEGFSHIERIRFSSMKCGPEAADLIKRSPNLRCVEFDSCSKVGEAIDALRDAGKVVDLRLENCKQIDDAVLAKLTSLCNLRSLILCDVPISPDSIEILKQFPHLEMLRVDLDSFRDAELQRLTELPRLNYLAIPNTYELSDETMRILRQRLQIVRYESPNWFGFGRWIPPE
jgi:hypothetical protein